MTIVNDIKQKQKNVSDKTLLTDELEMKTKVDFLGLRYSSKVQSKVVQLKDFCCRRCCFNKTFNLIMMNGFFQWPFVLKSNAIDLLSMNIYLADSQNPQIREWHSRFNLNGIKWKQPICTPTLTPFDETTHWLPLFHPI